jgi:tetratricopeptide (TPR) repeat protein
MSDGSASPQAAGTSAMLQPPSALVADAGGEPLQPARRGARQGSFAARPPLPPSPSPARTTTLGAVMASQRPRTSAWTRRLFLAAALTFPAAVAVAQDGQASSAVQESLDAEGRALYQAGLVAYRDGRFDAAERYFRQAYEASGRPELLYNIGVSAEQARHDDAALEAYEAFLEALPDAPQRARVETRIVTLREMGAGQADGSEAEEEEARPEVETAVAREVDEARPADASAGDGGEGAGPLPWVIVGVSGAIAVTGAILLGVGLGDISTVEGATNPARWADFEGAYDRAPTLTGIGITGLAVGLAGVALGVVLAVTAGGEAEGGVSLRVGPTALRLEGTF